ncbi:hypothetical protein [Candidatus Phycorickettsia trachydisci]|nr:hypothetical protein [Candidatus Phycorickettsia trachydisci]
MRVIAPSMMETSQGKYIFFSKIIYHEELGRLYSEGFETKEIPYKPGDNGCKMAEEVLIGDFDSYDDSWETHSMGEDYFYQGEEGM